MSNENDGKYVITLMVLGIVVGIISSLPPEVLRIQKVDEIDKAN